MPTDTPTATTTSTISTLPSSSTTTQEDSTMDTNEEPQAPNITTRGARAKASKDRLKALLVLRTPRPAETAPSHTQHSLYTVVNVKYNGACSRSSKMKLQHNNKFNVSHKLKVNTGGYSIMHVQNYKITCLAQSFLMLY